MAEVKSFQQVEQDAGRKLKAATNNRVRAAFFNTPAAHTFANGDTMGTGIILKAGTRLLPWATLSCDDGATSSTMSVGLRDPITKTAVDATAIIASRSLDTAGVFMPLTGTKLDAGEDYTLLTDMEIYATFGGATPTANSQVAVYVPYLAA